MEGWLFGIRGKTHTRRSAIIPLPLFPFPAAALTTSLHRPLVDCPQQPPTCRVDSVVVDDAPPIAQLYIEDKHSNFRQDIGVAVLGAESLDSTTDWWTERWTADLNAMVADEICLEEDRPHSSDPSDHSGRARISLEVFRVDRQQ